MNVSCLSCETGLFKNRYDVPLNSTNHMGMGLFLSPAAYNLSIFFLFLVKPKSSQGLFLRIILKRKHHVNHTVVVMAVVQHCPSLELPQHRPRGRAQTWTQSLNLTVKYSFYFRTRKEKYGSDFEKSPRLEKEPEGLNFSFMLWLPAYFPLFAFVNTARTRTVWLADTSLPGSAGVGQLPDQLWENAEFEENRAKRCKSSLP